MKPTLFNTDMVRAILEGRKTVTRRVVKPQPAGEMPDNHNICKMPIWTKDGQKSLWYMDVIEQYPFRRTRYFEKIAPFEPGDILYAREAFFEHKGKYYYKADGKHLALNDAIGGKEFFKWHPSIHMPREAARIFLRVTDVWVERLQDITADGIAREGIQSKKAGWMWTEFADLWNSTIKSAYIGIYGWAANPWVWVIQFEPCEKTEMNP